ncbi:MAG: ABC transporter ATP-binding protein [Crenarchaeota archaeon]|nr:ABC transporter ATP-binding protein [Thermoproteota archaeon]
MSLEIIGEFKSITKQFKTTIALNNLNLKIYQGINGLIGPNGAGKTTAIRLSLGLIKPTKGKAQLFGYDCWTNSHTIHKKVGVLYEKLAFYDNLTGFQQLETIAKLKNTPNPQTEIKKLLDFVELDKAAYNKRVNTYSAGMRQRLGLAQALIGNPQLVILDEPTSNLDPLNRIKIIKLITTLNKEKGTSFLISSHILPELEKVCDTFILMDKGRLLRQGTIKQMSNKTLTTKFLIKVQHIEPIIALLKEEKYIKDLSTVDDSLQVNVDDVLLFKQRLPLLIKKANTCLDELRMLNSDLESTFKSAVEEA